jgi:exodeoxyribonuclease VII large subunit
MSDIFTVERLNAYIRGLLESDAELQDVWVTGEVSNMKRATSGHWYFTIKDASSQLRCVMFRNHAERQSIQPNDGEAIRLHGKISVYEQRGEYQIYADEVQLAGGIGDLYQRFEELKRKLDAEGLFDTARKRPLPEFPMRIGIVTSPDAAAFRDIQNVLARRFPLAEVILSPTLVQGFDAPASIVKAIQRINQFQAADVLLICRGGGSIEDLWCFNDEQVVRTIAASVIPTVSGVGHETDFTIADFVADLRAPTPSAAAELVTPNINDLKIDVDYLTSDLTSQLEKVFADRYALLERANQRLGHISPERTLREYRQRIDDLSERIDNQQGRFLALLRERLTGQVRALNSASPDALLQRGYAIVTRSDDGKMLTDAADAPVGTRLTIKLKSGELKARTEDEQTHEQYKRTLF